MAAKKNRIPHKFHPWIAARKQFRLSDAHIQMARELGLNPKKMSGYADTKGKPWKLSLPEFIESLYYDRFKKPRPDTVKSMEQFAAEHIARREAKKAAKATKLSQNEEEDAPNKDSQNEGKEH